MLTIMDSDVIAQTNCVVQALSKSKAGTILGDAFQRKALKALEEKANRQYPYEVRIPKGIDYLLKGDFEPERVIKIEHPIPGPYGNMWFGDASSGVKLLCGYINGDSRYVFDTELGDAVVHGILVGATGQGKSVTLNSIIYNACTLYAPWEINLTLSDAKIVEFKAIAQNNPMPHIRIIAATGDTDYLLSVLQAKVDEMIKLNSVFTKAQNVFGKPVKKIEDFRKVTGLTWPQNLMIFDEYQAMYSNAKKLGPKITSLLDKVVRLGRNTGFHLLLASQEPSSDIPSNTMSNITFRAAMGCFPAVSEAILGNDKAMNNMGLKGRLIVNLNSAACDPTSNIDVRVPYIDPQTSEIAQVSIRAGAEMGVTPNLQFYDEFAVEYEYDFPKALEKLPRDPSIIYLGEPSFINTGGINRLQINLRTDELKNIMVVSPIQTDLVRHFLMLKYNALRYPEIKNLVMCANSIFEKQYHASELSPSLFFEDKDYENGQVFAIARSLIYRRILCIQTDQLVFSAESSVPDLTESNKLFYTVVEHGSELDNATNRMRFFYAKNILNTNPVLIEGFGQLSDEAKLDLILATLQTYATYDAVDSCLTLNRVPDLNVWLIGLDRILGIGISPKTRYMDSLKNLMFNGNSANVRFTIFASTLDEVGDLNDRIHWYIFDNPIQRDLNKAKVADSYPEQVGDSLAVMCDKKEPAKGCLKFKKLFFEGELPKG